MVHIEQIERTLLNKSSDRELALFRFLEGKRHSFKAKPNDLEDELCSKAFSCEDAISELEELKKIKPFKGFHYSNNLITLIAASLTSEESESSNVYKYLNLHSCRDLLIFSKALNKEFNLDLKPNTTVDSVAKKILNNELITQNDIGNCVTKITDLFDLFVVKQAVSLIWSQYEKSESIDIYKKISVINEKMIKRLNLLFTVIGSLAICWLLTYISPYVVDYATKHWDSLEPIAYLLDKALLLIGFLGAYKFINSEKAKNSITKYYFSFFYRLLGVSYSELTSLNHNLKSKT
ncbi:hypothetical protein ORJ00_02480 [Rheinheimera baltica]|uniref:hypothetical protein n=1 Tax=Rheinheimera baltica TaxID=67576 RepID=UPI00273F6195|nr:hypothetical protein [Rheinheimera baltica]MDP5141605.1 hypothetical protein [Rheinheimera baltica]